MVLRPTQHKIGHFGDILSSQSLWHSIVFKKLNLTHQKQTMQKQKSLRTHTTILRPFSGTTRVSRCQKKIFFWTLWCQERYQRQTHRQSGWALLHPD